MAGLAGKFVTTRQVRDRLMKELDKNIRLRKRTLEANQRKKETKALKRED